MFIGNSSDAQDSGLFARRRTSHSHDPPLQLNRVGNGVRDSSELANILVQQFKAAIVFIRVDDDLVGDGYESWRTVLPDAAKLQLDPAQIEIKHRRETIPVFAYSPDTGRIESLPMVSFSVQKRFDAVMSGEITLRDELGR